MLGFKFDKRAVDAITRMALENQTTFSDIQRRYGLNKREVVELMRRELKPSLFRMWCRRIAGRKTEAQKQYRAEQSLKKHTSSYRYIMGDLDSYWL